jgi:hypothetical protein
VGRSVHGNLLRYADPAWLDKVRLGIVLKLWNLLVALLVGATAAAAAFGLPAAVGQVGGFVAACLGLWALFLVTSPEPTVGLMEDVVTLRRVIRTAAVLGFVGNQLHAVATGTGGSIVLSIVGGALGLIGIVATFGEFVYFRRFARRVPNEELARSTSVVMWAFVTLGVVGVIAGVVGVFFLAGAVGGGSAFGPTGGAPPSVGPALLTGGLAFGTCLFGVAGVIFGLWYIALLFRYHSAFKTALFEARTLPFEELPQPDHVDTPGAP